MMDDEMATDGDNRTEWQFDALDLGAIERWLARHADATPPLELQARPSELQRDLYLDTDDWRFYRAGYALRLRRTGRRRQAEATLKSLDPGRPDAPRLRGRRELSETVELADPGVLALAPGPVGTRVRSVTGRKPLLQLFEVRTRRRTYTLTVDGVAPAELALDETTIGSAAGGSPARLRRVELEIPASARTSLAPVVERLRLDCALQPATLSKYDAGLLAADLQPRSAERFGATEVRSEMAIGEVALAVLRRHFSLLLAREPGTRLGDDSEELHQMRVASRRLRAAHALFADVLPPALAEARTELGWIGGMLGAVRDLDVQLEQHDAWLGELDETDREALAPLGRLLDEQRTTARAAMLEMLDSRRYQAFVARYGRLLRARRPRRAGPAAQPARALAPELIEDRFRRMRALGRRIRPGSPPTDYHRLRIRCKRLRYTLEFLADLYPGETGPLLRRLVALQDLLGLHQDGDVAIARLRALASDPAEALGAPTAFAMGEVAARYRREMADLRLEFPSAYAAITGKRWRSFRDEIERRRPVPPQRGEPAAETPSDS
jgi:CHAD domain-containing protein